MRSDGANRQDADFVGTLLGEQDPDPADDRRPAGRASRGERHRRSRRNRRRVVTLIAGLLVVLMVVGSYVIVRHVLAGFGPAKDYPGPGTTAVTVQIRSGDGTDDIAATLRTADVVASRAAFVNAAEKSGRSQDFQPGFFRLRKQMSGAEAVAALLDPSTRLSTSVTVTEGMIVPQILALLSTKLKIPLASLTAASKDISNLGIPDGYAPKSAEGFLYPQTYSFDPGTTAPEALQTLVQMYGTEARALNFSAGATKVGLTPYQALIVASMVEAEVKFDGDRAKVARVVYNRLAAGMNLGFDTTTAYEYRLKGLDPTKATYTENSPYNTRTHAGLPPTPIGNPGAKSMTAAINPAPGNWLYFVSADAAGHLFFTNDYNAFLAATQTCINNKWGCT